MDIEKKTGPVLRWSDVLVIRLHPKHVSGRVDQPGEVKDSHVPGIEMRKGGEGKFRRK